MVFDGARRLSARAKTYSRAVGVALLVPRGLTYPERVCGGAK